MFDLSGHNKGESEESGTSYRNTGERTEFKSLNLVDCPSILTGLSREMRTQMNAIVAFSFLLNKDEYTKVEKEEFINQIYNSCNRIISLFDNFLDSAIIETGQSRPGSGICNTNEVFADIYSEFRETLKQEKYKDVVLVTENVAVQDSDHLVDANMLRKIIHNLFQTALNNTESGFIKTGYQIINNRLMFLIKDSGHGYLKCREFLQSEDLAKSLIKFNDPYTAVSMALTRQLIHMMNGYVWIEANGLKGSAIYLSIPVIYSVNTEDRKNRFSNTMSTI